MPRIHAGRRLAIDSPVDADLVVGVLNPGNLPRPLVISWSPEHSRTERRL